MEVTGNGITALEPPCENPFPWATERPYEGETANFIEAYRGWGVWWLTGPGVYGVTDPSCNELDVYQTSLAGARRLIDDQLDQPVFVQYYPPESPTHLENEWGCRIEIRRDSYGRYAAFSEFHETSSNPTGKISAWWPSDNLAGLLKWIDETYIPEGIIPYKYGHPETLMYFYHEKYGLHHVYEATVGGHTKRFDAWRYQACYDWIDTELEPEPEPAKGSITTYTAPASALPGETVAVTATAKNTGSGSGSFRLKLIDRDTNADIDTTAWFTLAAGSSTTKNLSGTMPDRDWNLKLILERTLATGAVTIDDEKKFTAINIVNWWDAIRAKWNSLATWQKALIIGGTAGGIVAGGATLKRR